MSGHQKSHPILRILGWAFGVGSVSFSAGFFGPAYFAPSANLAPLLGVFVTGPLGLLAGAVIGALTVAKDWRRLAIACISLVWVMTLLYTFRAFALGGWAGVPTLPLHLLVLVSSIYLFLYAPAARAQLPDVRRRCGAVAAGAVATITLMTLFPPVTRLSMLPAAQQSVTDAPLPPFASIFDSGFGPHSGYSLFAVNEEALAAEWIITLVLAIGLCLLMRALHRRPAA
jgi:hypothetical protein